MAALLVIAGLVAAPTAPGVRRVARTASIHTECCFVLTVRAKGSISAAYSDDYSTPGLKGSESYTWNWGTRTLLEYSEYGGQPQLERPLNKKREPTPSLREHSTWDSSSNEVYVHDPSKPPAPAPCRGGPADAGALLMDTELVDIERLRDTPANVRTLFAGHTFALRLLTDPRFFGYDAPCMDTHSVGELEAPPLANGDPDAAHQLMGSRPYYTTLPPRAFLRQSRGAKKTVSNHYARSISFTHGDPDSGEAHKVTETTQMTATFHWFPRSRLAKNVQRLRDEAKP